MLEGVEGLLFNFLCWGKRVEVSFLLVPCTISDTKCLCWLGLSDYVDFGWLSCSSSFLRRWVLSVALVWFHSLHSVSRSISEPACVGFISVGTWLASLSNFHNAVLFHDFLFLIKWFACDCGFSFRRSHIVLSFRKAAIVLVGCLVETVITILIGNSTRAFYKAKVHLFLRLAWSHHHKFIIVHSFIHQQLDRVSSNSISLRVLLFLLWVDQPWSCWGWVSEYVLASKRIEYSLSLRFSILWERVEICLCVVAYVSQVIAKEVRVAQLWTSFGYLLLSFKRLGCCNFADKLSSYGTTLCSLYGRLCHSHPFGIAHWGFVFSYQSYYFVGPSLVRIGIGRGVWSHTVCSSVDYLLLHNLNCVFDTSFRLDLNRLKVEVQACYRLRAACWSLRRSNFLNHSKLIASDLLLLGTLMGGYVIPQLHHSWSHFGWPFRNSSWACKTLALCHSTASAQLLNGWSTRLTILCSPLF